MMDRLRALVRRYVAGEVAYNDFRREFIEQFQAAADNDAEIRRFYSVIEGGCSAFENAYIDEPSLKAELSKSVLTIVQIQNFSLAQIFDVYLEPSNVNRVISVRSSSNSFANSFAPYAASNSSIVFDEPVYEYEELIA